jgi:hypothetical protein
MHLSKLVAASLAAMAFMAGSAMAETVTAGYINGSYANVSSDGPDVDVWGVGGALSTPLGGGDWGSQFDLAYYNADDGFSSDDVFTGTAHVFNRTDARLLGVAIGAIDSDNANSTTWGAALEGDWYLDNSTVGGRIVYLNNDDASTDFWGVDGHYRAFVTDNLRLEGNLGYGQLSDDFGDDVDIWAVSAEAEYRFDSNPISVYASIGYANLDANFGGSEDATVASVGVRFNLGQDSGKDRDRRGPSLKSLDNILGVGSAGALLSGAGYYAPPPDDEEELED